MLSKTTLKSIIRRNCTALGVPCPRLEIGPPSLLPTGTTRAALSDDGKTVYLNSLYYPSMTEPEAWLYLSHECRHIHQLMHGFNPLEDYSSGSDVSLTVYASQFAEIDANAWAVVVCSSVLGIAPTFGGVYSAAVHEAIYSRARVIAAQYNAPGAF